MIEKSLWGIMLLFWSIIGLAIALYRQEIVLLSWALGTGTVLLLNLTFNLACYYGLWQTNKKLTYHLPLPLFCNHEGVMVLNLAKTLPSFFLFSHSLKLSWHFAGYPVFHTFHPLPSGQRDITLAFTPPKRGVFTIKHQLVCSDIFSIFTLATSAVEGKNQFVVGLGHSRSSEELNLILAKIPSLAKISAMKDSEFSQHRSYNPGEDPRRINWTLYARFNDLFIRAGEGSATVTKEITIRLLPPRWQPHILDELLKTAYFMSDFIINKQFNTLLSIDKQLEIAHFSGHDTTHRLALAPIRLRDAELGWNDWVSANDVIWLLAHEDVLEWAKQVKDGHALVVMDAEGQVKCCQVCAEALVYV